MTALHITLVLVATLASLSALGPVRARLASGGHRERGASALEFAIIAAIVVVAASLIGGVIYKIVSDKSKKLETCASQPVGAACTP